MEMLACVDVLDDQIKCNAKTKANTPLVTNCILVPIILAYNGKVFSKAIAWFKVIPLFCVFFFTEVLKFCS
jgi:hypothetical protein